MTYATQQDLIDRFGADELTQLTDRTNSGTIDAAVIAKALADAYDEINSYVATRYTLPFATTPNVVKRIAGDIARYFLYEDRATDQVTKRYEDAIKFLKSVASGGVTLGLDAANQVATQSGGPDFKAGDRVFTTGSPNQGTEGTLDDY